jgi:hypothetical protein
MEKSQENTIEEILSELSLEQPEEEKVPLSRSSPFLGIQYMIIDTVPICQKICERITGGQIAMDIEGIDLCRTGTICIIQVAVEDDPVVKLFDITVLG